MLLQRANQRPERIILFLPTSFSRPGSAKISENPQKSSDLPHQGLQAERDRGQQGHTGPRTGHRITCTSDPQPLQHIHASARSLCFTAEQSSKNNVFTHLTGRSTTLTDSNTCQLHEKCSSKPS